MMTKWIEFTVQAVDIHSFNAALIVLEKASQKEDGCVDYRVFQSTDESTLFTVFESWATEEDFEAHRVASHTNMFKEQCGVMIISKRALTLNPLLKGD